MIRLMKERKVQKRFIDIFSLTKRIELPLGKKLLWHEYKVKLKIEHIETLCRQQSNLT
jgi:hypothetical protein